MPPSAVGADVAAAARLIKTIDAPPAAPLMAPYFETLKPHAPSGLELTWTNMSLDCDSMEIMRKDGLNSYATVGTPAPGPQLFDDPTATLNQNYTYKLRCKRGAEFSPWSWEMSANPTM